MKQNPVYGFCGVHDFLWLCTVTLFYFVLKCYCAFQKHANSEVQKPTEVAFFAAVNHFSGLLRKQNLISMNSKGRGL